MSRTNGNFQQQIDQEEPPVALRKLMVNVRTVIQENNISDDSLWKAAQYELNLAKGHFALVV